MEKKMVVEGMKCIHCKASVEKALKAVEGVSGAEVDLESKTATVFLDKDVENSILMEAVRNKGFDPVEIV